MDVILEDSPNYKYSGRLEVDEWRSEERNSKIIINYILEPYKVSISTGERSL